MTEVSDQMVRLAGDVLMQHGLNAPEQAIYQAARAALAAALAARPAPTGEKVEALLRELRAGPWYLELPPETASGNAAYYCSDAPAKAAAIIAALEAERDGLATKWQQAIAIGMLHAERAATAERERDEAIAKLKDIEQDLPYVMGWNAGYAHATEQEGDETHAIGVREGYENAIQDIDLATGGDGEFKGSTTSGQTVDIPAMKRRIIERFTALSAANARVERLERALTALIAAFDRARMVPVRGVGGMTIEANIRGSVYNGVPAWPVEEARAALAGGENAR